MLDGYVSEKEQIESLRKFWNEHGKFILIAVIIGLAIGFGWRYFHTLEKRRAENAAMVYQSIAQADAKGDFTTVEGGANILRVHFSNTPYASLASLLSAKEMVTKNDLSGAISTLQWIVAHSDEQRLKQIARIDLARIYLSQNNTAAAMTELAVVNDKTFEPLIDWVKGDINAQEHHAKEARDYYEKAKNALAEFPPAAKVLDKKIAQPIN